MFKQLYSLIGNLTLHLSTIGSLIKLCETNHLGKYALQLFRNTVEKITGDIVKIHVLH